MCEPLMKAMEKNAGGCTDEQRKNWQKLWDKAYADQKEWGWH